MARWKEYILTVIGCALFCGVISIIASDLRCKKLLRMVCGTLLAIVILKPLTSDTIVSFPNLDIEMFSPERYVDLGKQAALDAQEKCIREACEAYISSTASEFGLTVTSDVYLNEKMEPCFAQIYGDDASGRQCELEQLLEDDLGITKENQVWIWNREKDSS